MKISRHIHQQIRIKNLFATVIFLCALGTLAWLSSRYTLQTDVTGNAANTLSEASIKLLASMPDSIAITAYIKKDQPIRNQIAQLVDRYRRHKSNLQLTFIDPDAQPEKARELAIGSAGAIIVDYQGRSEKLSFIDESSLTNALLQLANAEDRWISFLGGHGERSPDGRANFDLGEFGTELQRRKINAQSINLGAVPAIPDNAALLVITAPAVPWLPAETAIFDAYIKRGGNLLILSDPGNQNLSVVINSLGLRQLPGTLVDNSVTLYGVNDPSFVLVSDYPPHPVTQGFQTTTLYPVAAALETAEETEFKAEILLRSSSQSWTETGAIAGKIRFDADSDEKQGPLAFAVALSRSSDAKTQQRIIVAGDGDFLSNAYIGNVGNLDMGLRMINWLIHDDRFINIPAKVATDKSLQLSQTEVAVIGFGFLLIIPLLLLGTGLFIWRKRRQR
jgi:ABC-type uncharacterized transport system involved in gliding motility auxiliary subunit